MTDTYGVYGLAEFVVTHDSLPPTDYKEGEEEEIEEENPKPEWSREAKAIYSGFKRLRDFEYIMNISKLDELDDEEDPL